MCSYLPVHLSLLILRYEGVQQGSLLHPLCFPNVKLHYKIHAASTGYRSVTLPALPFPPPHILCVTYSTSFEIEYHRSFLSNIGFTRIMKTPRSDSSRSTLPRPDSGLPLPCVRRHWSVEANHAARRNTRTWALDENIFRVCEFSELCKVFFIIIFLTTNFYSKQVCVWCCVPASNQSSAI